MSVTEWKLDKGYLIGKARLGKVSVRSHLHSAPAAIVTDRRISTLALQTLYTYFTFISQYNRQPTKLQLSFLPDQQLPLWNRNLHYP